MSRKRVVVIEGEDAAPEAVQPTVEVLERLGCPIDWLHPPVGERGIRETGDPFPPEARAAIDTSDSTLSRNRAGRSTYAEIVRCGASTSSRLNALDWASSSLRE